MPNLVLSLSNVRGKTSDQVKIYLVCLPTCMLFSFPFHLFLIIDYIRRCFVESFLHIKYFISSWVQSELHGHLLGWSFEMGLRIKFINKCANKTQVYFKYRQSTPKVILRLKFLDPTISLPAVWRQEIWEQFVRAYLNSQSHVET